MGCPGGVRASKCWATMVVSVTSSCTGFVSTVPTSTANARAGTRSEARAHARGTIRRRTGSDVNLRRPRLELRRRGAERLVHVGRDQLLVPGRVALTDRHDAAP